MIGLRFDATQLAELKRLELSESQIGALEYFLPLCAMYLQPNERAKKNDVIDNLTRALDGVTTARKFIENQQLTPAHFEAVHLVAATVGYSGLRKIDNALSELQAALTAAQKARNVAGQTRKEHSLAPLALVHIALHTGSSALDVPLHDLLNNLPTDGLEDSLFRPSQSITGPFATVAHIVYQALTGDDVPERALEAFAKTIHA